MSHVSRVRRAAPPLLLALLGVGCVPNIVRTPLADAHRKAIVSSKTIGNVSQDELGTSIEESSGGRVVGGLLGAAIDEAVNLGRADSARAAVGQLRDALFDHEPKQTAQRALTEEVKKVGVLQATKLEFQSETRRDRRTVSAIIERAGADALLIIDFDYRLSPDFEFIVVGCVATLFPAPAATSPELKRLADSPGPLPPVLYRGVFLSSMQVPPGEGTPVARWSANRGALAREAIDGGIAEVVRMFAWDVDQAGASGDSYAARGVAFVQFEEFGLAKLYPVGPRESRTWYRADSGEVVSIGPGYGAPGKNAAKLAPKSAVSSASASPMLSGALAGTEVVYAAGRAIMEEQENVAAMERASGKDHGAQGTGVVRVDERQAVSVDRLRGGRVPFPPTVEAYASARIASEMTRLGLSTAAGAPTLRCEIQEAKLDRAAREVSLRMRYQLTTAAGNVTYTAEKTTVGGVLDGAASEAEAFHIALRRAVEALALDTAFVAAIGGELQVQPAGAPRPPDPRPETDAGQSPIATPAAAARRGVPLAGKIGSVHAVYRAGRETLACPEKAASMQRAFGSSYDERESCANPVPMDRLRKDGAVMSPDVEAYAAQTILDALAEAGAATGAGGPTLHLEIEEANVDRFVRHVSIRVRWELKDASGKVLHAAIKTTVGGPHSEAEAFRMALRKSLEAAVADPRFAGALE